MSALEIPDKNDEKTNFVQAIISDRAGANGVLSYFTSPFVFLTALFSDVARTFLAAARMILASARSIRACRQSFLLASRSRVDLLTTSLCCFSMGIRSLC